MNVHEFQAKSLFAQFGVPVPRGKEITSPEAATTWANELNTPVFVVKAQIHAGGRGKAGGVKITKDKTACAGFAKELIGKTLVTHQTGPKGRKVHRLLMEEGANIAKELYLSILVDRETGWPTFIASTEGGMEIEEVAEKTPEKIIKEPIDPASRVPGTQWTQRRLCLGSPAHRTGRDQSFRPDAGESLSPVHRKECRPRGNQPACHHEGKDADCVGRQSVVRRQRLFKHEDVQKMRDLNEEEPLEIEATANNLNYVKLDGNIGCMVNGAGLAMATMDVIKLAGSEPANFLDVGGGATKETVAAGFRILLKDPNVKGIFINIFGGIVRCERIAHGVIEAAKEVKITVPLVVRLQGTNAEEGRKLLTESGLKLRRRR